MKERLEWMDRAYLSAYESMEIDSNIPMQKPFDAMKFVETTSLNHLLRGVKMLLNYR